MIEFFLHIGEDGKMTNPQVAKKYFGQLTAGRWLVQMKRANKRTLAQNDWFHAVLPDITRALRELGFEDVRTTEDAKAVVKALFFKKVISNGIEDIEVIEGTSETSKENFAERADEIIRWGQEYLGIDIAPPGKLITMFE